MKEKTHETHETPFTYLVKITNRTGQRLLSRTIGRFADRVRTSLGPGAPAPTMAPLLGADAKPEGDRSSGTAGAGESGIVSAAIVAASFNGRGSQKNEICVELYKSLGSSTRGQVLERRLLSLQLGCKLCRMSS